jgi:hypothetical protein
MELNTEKVFAANVAIVGTREPSYDQFCFVKRLAAFLVYNACRIHTGGALGVDQAAIEGACRWDGSKVLVHLPWPSYNRGEFPDLANINAIVPNPEDDELLELAKLHPAWDKLSIGVKSLMFRNASIIKASDTVFALPSMQYGRPAGGTAHDILIAKKLGLPVFMLTEGKVVAALDDMMKAERQKIEDYIERENGENYNG